MPLSKEIDDFITDFNFINTRLDEFRKDIEKEYVPVISKDVEAFLVAILNTFKPRYLLEVGTGAGYSAILFASILENAQITSIELIDKRYESAIENIRDFALNENIDVIQGDARDILVELKEKGHEFDFVFIDSAKSHYREFFEKALALSHDGTIIICDNILLAGRTISDKYIKKHREKTSAIKMRKFVDYINTMTDVDSVLLPIGDGIILSRVGKC